MMIHGVLPPSPDLEESLQSLWQTSSWRVSGNFMPALQFSSELLDPLLDRRPAGWHLHKGRYVHAMGFVAATTIEELPESRRSIILSGYSRTNNMPHLRIVLGRDRTDQIDHFAVSVMPPTPGQPEASPPEYPLVEISQDVLAANRAGTLSLERAASASVLQLRSLALGVGAVLMNSAARACP